MSAGEKKIKNERKFEDERNKKMRKQKKPESAEDRKQPSLTANLELSSAAKSKPVIQSALDTAGISISKSMFPVNIKRAARGTVKKRERGGDLLKNLI